MPIGNRGFPYLAAFLLGAFLMTFGSAIPAQAASQCFKNLDNQNIHISLRYKSGAKVDMELRPGEKRRFNNVGRGDIYCYSFQPIGRDCPNKNPVHLTSCQNPQLIN